MITKQKVGAKVFAIENAGQSKKNPAKEGKIIDRIDNQVLGYYVVEWDIKGNKFERQEKIYNIDEYKENNGIGVYLK